MSYITDAYNGIQAVESKNWTEAIDLLSSALQESENPAWLLARSQAYQETKQIELALADAEHAFCSALQRQEAKGHQQMVLAQYRRAVCLGHLKRYADADACCVWSQELIQGKNFLREPDTVTTRVDADGDYLVTPEEALSTSDMPDQKPDGLLSGPPSKSTRGADWSRAYVWRSMMLNAMKKLPKGDPARKITVLRIPKKPSKKSSAKTASAVPVQTPAKQAVKKLRVDFYQATGTVNLVLYAKGVDKEKLNVDVHESEIRLSNLPEAAIGSTWVVLDLSGAVDVSADKVIKVTPFKIEITLNKKTAGEKWGTWGTQRDGQSGAPPAATDVSPDAQGTAQPAANVTAPATENKGKTAAAAAAPKTKPTAPVYPTSSRTGPKNWETLAVDADDDTDSDVNAFFKKLYANSTPEQQRAMAKSFVESNGTALSTDWNSVKTGEVATQPPDGVEAKKWD